MPAYVLDMGLLGKLPGTESTRQTTPMRAFPVKQLKAFPVEPPAEKGE